MTPREFSVHELHSLAHLVRCSVERDRLARRSPGAGAHDTRRCSCCGPRPVIVAIDQHGTLGRGVEEAFQNQNQRTARPTTQVRLRESLG